jgi:hypothetical protein
MNNNEKEISLNSSFDNGQNEEKDREGGNVLDLDKESSLLSEEKTVDETEIKESQKPDEVLSSQNEIEGNELFKRFRQSKIEDYEKIVLLGEGK